MKHRSARRPSSPRRVRCRPLWSSCPLPVPHLCGGRATGNGTESGHSATGYGWAGRQLGGGPTTIVLRGDLSGRGCVSLSFMGIGFRMKGVTWLQTITPRLAEEAGRLLLGYASTPSLPGRPLTLCGRPRPRPLAARLAEYRSGEWSVGGGVDDKARLTADRVWIVDPLDGTREFGIEGRTDWAVHVALWVRGCDAVGALAAGAARRAVALPAQGRVLSTPEPGPRPGAGHSPSLRPAGREPEQGIPAGQGRRGPDRRRARPVRLRRGQGSHRRVR